MAYQDPDSWGEKRGWHGSTMDGFLGYLDKAEKRRQNGAIKILQLLLELQPTKKSEKAVDVARKKDLLDDELSKYQFVPDLSPRPAGGWTIEWQILIRGKAKSQSIDNSALQMILRFATGGQLNRLRKCSLCSHWMYAKFRHQMFCSTKCQQRHYAQSEKWKLYRSKYMREYRGKRHDQRVEFGSPLPGRNRK
jgi:hypothetical protein